MFKSYNNKGLRLYHNHNQITFIHTHQWFLHDTIKLVVHATRTNGVVTIRSHSVGLNRKVFMFSPSVLSIGFSMRYNTSILFMTVGLVSFVSTVEVRQKFVHQQCVWVFIIFNLGIKRNAKIFKVLN